MAELWRYYNGKLMLDGYYDDFSTFDEANEHFIKECKRHPKDWHILVKVLKEKDPSSIMTTFVNEDD